MAEKKASECTPEELARRHARQKAADEKRDKPKRAALRRAWEAKNRERLAAKKRAWRDANPERFAASANGRMRRWRQRNPEAVCALAARRRAKKLLAAAGCPKSRVAYERWARRALRLPCYWCRAVTKPGERHIDHIIPLSKGGADSVANLCVACPHCNQSKSAQLPEDFAGQSELRLA